MADEKRPFETPEDLGESLAGHAASPGAGARKSQAASESELERQGKHQRVQSGAEEPGAPFSGTEAKETIGNAPPIEQTEDVSDEEFRKAVEELHEEREQQRKAG